MYMPIVAAGTRENCPRNVIGIFRWLVQGQKATHHAPGNHGIQIRKLDGRNMQIAYTCDIALK